LTAITEKIINDTIMNERFKKPLPDSIEPTAEVSKVKTLEVPESSVPWRYIVSPSNPLDSTVNGSSCGNFIISWLSSDILSTERESMPLNNHALLQSSLIAATLAKSIFSAELVT
jgi:hypothetical protein